MTGNAADQPPARSSLEDIANAAALLLECTDDDLAPHADALLRLELALGDVERDVYPPEDDQTEAAPWPAGHYRFTLTRHLDADPWPVTDSWTRVLNADEAAAVQRQWAITRTNAVNVDDDLGDPEGAIAAESAPESPTAQVADADLIRRAVSFYISDFDGTETFAAHAEQWRALKRRLGSAPASETARHAGSPLPASAEQYVGPSRPGQVYRYERPDQ